MPRVASKAKCCATCRWWKGERNIIFESFTSSVPRNVEYSPAQSECAAIRQKTIGSRVCSKWTKWELL
ncbi:MAG: hypothetical protein IJD28_01685 [Deferribacterales bacterium]|nr:hypothetical protein [Deferribacterales bacterium]